MAEGFEMRFPAKIGATVYLVTKTGCIHENVVDGYSVFGTHARDVRVRLAYTDRAGRKKMNYRSVGLFGKLIFCDPRQADTASMNLRVGGEYDG